MNREVSNKLIRNLSLYLDNELPKEEMVEIEELLKIDKEVSEIFDSLKKAKLVLRNAPRIKRRKSFTLSREHVKQVKRESGWINGMRLVSSFSMILLLVVFTQNLLGDWSPLNNIYLGSNNSVEDSVAMENMEFAVQDAADEKAVDDVDDTSADDSADLDEAASGVGEADVEDCDVDEICVDPTSTYSADDSLEEERATSPEDVLGEGEDIPTDEADSEEDSDIAEDAVDAEVDQSDTTDDAEKIADAETLVEEAEEIEVVGKDDAEGAEVEFEGDIDESKNSMLLIVLAVITALSSGTYLFLRKKYS